MKREKYMMMKFFKIIFSKSTIVVLLLLIQILLIFGAFFLLNEYFMIFQALFFFLAIFIFFKIINKKQSPEFKLPWIFVVLVLPLFGSFIYLMFSNQKLTKKQSKYLTELSNRTKPYLNKTPEEKDKIIDYLDESKYIEKYISGVTEYGGYLNSKAQYFNSGENFYEDLLKELKKAKKFIFMEYFIIDEGEMWNSIFDILVEKAKSGVEVRVLYDDLGTIGKLKRNFYKKLRANGIKCHKFNTFKPVISAVHNNRDHRKITVIDGKIGYTGGVNLADEYINKKQLYGHWKDSAVKISGVAVKNMTSMFLQMYDMNIEEYSDYSKYLEIKHQNYDEEGYIIPFGDGPKPFFKDTVGENVFLNLINSAKKYIYITTPYLIIDYSLITALRNASLRGVDVRIITPHIPDKKVIFKITQSNYDYLLEAGVKIYEYEPGFIHAKSIISDDEVGFVGTINFDYRSLVHHFECGVIMYKTKCLTDIKNDITQTISKSIEIKRGQIKRSFWARLYCSILNLFSPML